MRLEQLHVSSKNHLYDLSLSLLCSLDLLIIFLVVGDYPTNKSGVGDGHYRILRFVLLYALMCISKDVA